MWTKPEDPNRFRIHTPTLSVTNPQKYFTRKLPRITGVLRRSGSRNSFHRAIEGDEPVSAWPWRILLPCRWKSATIASGRCKVYERGEIISGRGNSLVGR